MTEFEHEDCRRMLDRLYAFHDGELDESEMDEIREHLMKCEPCLDHYEVEKAYRVLIRRGCGNERAPEELQLRLHTSLLSVTWQSDSGGDTSPDGA